MFQNTSLKIRIGAIIYAIVSVLWKIYYEILEAMTRESFSDYFLSSSLYSIFKTLMIVCIIATIIYMFGLLVARYEIKNRIQ